MAKLAFSKLGLKVNNQVINVNYNEQNIEVKQYISVNDKLKLISDVINNSIGEHSFCNPVQVSVYYALGMIEYYTNITFTEKQKEDPVKLYDLFKSNGLLNEINKNIPKAEKDELTTGLWDSINSIYSYNNSVMGILENIGRDYKDTILDAENIRKELGDEKNMAFLKEVLAKLG